jgi:hypothetical protein
MSEEDLGIPVVKAGRPVSRLRSFFEKAAIVLIGAGLLAGEHQYQQWERSKTFNPVYDIMARNGLIGVAAHDANLRNVCDAYADQAGADKPVPPERLMTVFYACNAVDHPAFRKDLPFSRAIADPPEGLWSSDVEEQLAETVNAQIARGCASGVADQAHNGDFMNGLCRATGQPGYKIS